MSKIDPRRDPRFDAIVAQMQVNSETMPPAEVLATALADAYIVGTEDGKQERDLLQKFIEVRDIQAKDLAEQRDELQQRYDLLDATSDTLLQDLQRLQALAPECPVHGLCTPHAAQWLQAAINERDELRAQVAMLRDNATHYRHAFRRRIEAENQGTYEDVVALARIEDGYRNQLFNTIDQTPAQAAQYVQGLEDALQALLDDRDVQRVAANTDLEAAQQALAAKEDRHG